MKLRSVRGTHDIFGEEIDKFNFISNIKNFSILGGDLFRRPIYTSAVSFYKFQDMLKLINR